MIKTFFLLTLVLLATAAFAQIDSLANARNIFVQDSLQKADSALMVKAQKLRDSLGMVYIKAPNKVRFNYFIDSLLNKYKVQDAFFLKGGINGAAKQKDYRVGKEKAKGQSWVIGIIILLILTFGIINRVFSTEVSLIIKSFYNNRTLNQISKEDNLFTSWPFIFLYLLFGFTIGIFLYISALKLRIGYVYEGFNLFIILSVSVITLFTLKILVTRVLGFIFDVKRLVRDYVSVLYLTYFNLAFIFIPITVLIALAPISYSYIFLAAAIVCLAVIFFFQFGRVSLNILSNYKFPLIYLFLYLCALEICPLIILFKALKF